MGSIASNAVSSHERPVAAPDGVELKLALFVDVETTGLDHTKDKIIELALVPFTYGPDGRVYEAFQRVHQPKSPISDIAA